MPTRTPEGELLHDVTVRFQVYLERLKAGEVKKLDPTLRALDRAVRSALGAVQGRPSARQLAGVLATLRKDFERLTGAHNAASAAMLRDLSAHAAEFHAQTLGLVWPQGAPALVTPAVAGVWAQTMANPIHATGELLTGFMESWSVRAYERVEGAIRVGYAQGKTTDEIIRTIRGTKSANFADGILGGVTKREAASVTRTAIQQVANQAQACVYDANDDIVEGYMWVSTLDSRTTSQCQSLDHRVFKLRQGPMPPIHVNCRSTTIPKLIGVDLLEGTTRASKGAEGGKQVAATESYFEWLKKQPKAFQIDALGAARAQLFAKGGLTAKEFAALNLDKNFEPLTLEQMRKKNPIAFERAGM